MIKRFLGYVEIKTKITSIFAFLMSLAFLFYKKQPINIKCTLIFFSSMFLFDLTTTAINNYIDTKTNNQILQFKRKTAYNIIIVMLLISTLLGIYLYLLTDIVVLLIGGICFICGVLYTWGPVPISRQPLGEVLSGIFYGLFIPFLMVYINFPRGTFIDIIINLENIVITTHNWDLLTIGLLSLTPILTTANIMLANNICDVEKDIQVRRYTLPYYLEKKALPLFAAGYYLTYLVTVIMVGLKMLSPICLISLLTFFFVKKNIEEFMKKQEKETTFIVSIKNYIIIMGVNTLMIFISGLF